MEYAPHSSDRSENEVDSPAVVSVEDYSDSAINQASTHVAGEKVFITLPGPIGTIGAISLARARARRRQADA